MMTAGRSARAFTWITGSIILCFTSASLSMIALTIKPGSEFLWMLNLSFNELFRYPLYILHDVLQFTVMQVAVASALLALIVIFVGPLVGSVRFLMSHVTAVVVSLPMIRAVVASNDSEIGHLVATSGWASNDFTEIDAIRYPLMLLAWLACLGMHAEWISRARRDRAVAGRARRLLR